MSRAAAWAEAPRTGGSAAVLWLGALFVAAVFFLATHDPLASIQWQRTLPGEVESLVTEISSGRLQRRVAFPALAAFGLLGLLLRARTRGRIDPVLAGLAGSLLLWSILSLAWSDDPAFTGRRLAVLGMTALGAAALVRRLTLRESILLLTASAALLVAVGVATEVFLGTFRPLDAAYRFAGTQHPNQQAIGCAVLVLGAAYLATVSRDGGRRLAVLAAGLGLLFLVLTRSRTAFASVLAASLVFVLLTQPRSRGFAVALAAGWVGGALLLLFYNGLVPAPWEAFLLGRDAAHLGTLTGRTEIWDLALARAAERPLLGYGYSSFWTPERTGEIAGAVDWKISEGHSAYLDVLLGLGTVGLALFLGLLVAGLARAVGLHRRTGDAGYALVAALLVFVALDGLLESAITFANFLSFSWMVLLGTLAFRRPGAAARRPRARERREVARV